MIRRSPGPPWTDGRRSPAGHCPPTAGLLAERVTVCLVSLGVYLAAAGLLVFHFKVIPIDSFSRVANAYYVLYSRDPHLGALGFVWNPLPSLLDLPLLPLKGLWPALSSQAFAGNIVTALFMAGAVFQLHGLLAEMGVGRLTRVLLTALFAFHPMILYYGANGMSEGPFMFFLLFTVRSLARWWRVGELRSLVSAGVALGLAYLVRYEAVATGAGAVLAVALTTARGTRGTSRFRRQMGITDAAILGAPLALTVLVWAGMSWTITGHPFEQFSGVYGNTAQVAAQPPEAAGAAIRVLRQLLGLEPLFGVTLLLFLFRTTQCQRNPEAIAAVVVLGAVVALQAIAAGAGKTPGFLRYQLAIVPLVTLLAGWLSVDLLGERRTGQGKQASRGLALGRGALALAIVGLALPTALRAMKSATLGPAESIELSAVLHPGQSITDRYRAEREVARYVDALRPPRGSVLVDTFSAVPIFLSSRRPDEFVITSDRDFRIVLADPPLYGVRYVLARSPTGLGQLDAVNREFPFLYRTGRPLGTLVRQFTNRGNQRPTWRLYAVGRTLAASTAGDGRSGRRRG